MQNLRFDPSDRLDGITAANRFGMGESMSRLAGRTVLMVEDDERIRDSMRLFFQAVGFGFKAVKSAELR